MSSFAISLVGRKGKFHKQQPNNTFIDEKGNFIYAPIVICEGEEEEIKEKLHKLIDTFVDSLTDDRTKVLEK